MFFALFMLQLAQAEEKSLALGLTADAYGRFDANQPDNRFGSNPTRPIDYINGLSVAWVGADIRAKNGPVRAVADLRFGPASLAYYGNDALIGLSSVKQGFVSADFGSFTLDAGKFDTIYGGEALDAYKNANYTRSGLHWAVQPFYHTGIRTHGRLSKTTGIKLMAVNGWNNSFDNNSALSYGAQLNTKAGPTSISIGYLGGPEQDEILSTMDEETGEMLASMDEDVNSRWRHFTDLVVTTEVDKVDIIINANYATEELADGSSVSFLGAALIADYKLSEQVHTAVRGEYIQDPNGFLFGAEDGDITSGTLTVGYIPRKQLEFKADLRYDMGAEDYFAKGASEMTDNSFQVIVGAVYRSFHELN